jgi:hypothetical protein
MDRDQVKVDVIHRLAAGGSVQIQHVHRIGLHRLGERTHEARETPVHGGEFRVPHVPDLGPVRLRDDQHMAAPHRVHVHERERAGIFEDLGDGGLSRDDAAEHAVRTPIPGSLEPGLPGLRHCRSSRADSRPPPAVLDCPGILRGSA